MFIQLKKRYSFLRNFSFPLCLFIAILASTNAQGSLNRLTPLAETGQFDQALRSLNQVGNSNIDPKIKSLRNAYQKFINHRNKALKQKAEDYEKALKKMEKYSGLKKIEDALIYAVEAHGLANVPKTMLNDPRTKSLIAKAKQHATEAEQKQFWLEALSLYRTLNLIYDPKSPYKKDVDRVTLRVRVLRLYAPDLLNDLYIAHAKRRGKKDVKAPIPPHQDTWEIRLLGVSKRIVFEALRNAAYKHIKAKGFGPLLIKGIQTVQEVLATPGLETTFTGLKDRNKLALVTKKLDQKIQLIKARKHPMGSYEASSFIESLVRDIQAKIKLPDNVLLYEFANGAMSMLDPFSTIIWPYDKNQFQRHTQGQFSGVGIQISLPKNRLTVVSPLPNTPAFRAGIISGDIIAKVNGIDTSNWTLEWAVHEITGPSGSFVTLGIERKGHKDLIDFKVQRQSIKIHSVEGWKRRTDDPSQWDYYIDAKNKIGYIRLSQFIPQSPDDLLHAINLMDTTNGLNALILDLRFNPGGLLRKSVDIVNFFVPNGTVVSTIDNNSVITSQYRAKPHKFRIAIPLVLLVNQGSASAAEIVSGALQDHQKAIIVGTRTFGKGSVQDLYPLGKHVNITGSVAYIKLTTQHYQLPLGRQIHREENSVTWGVKPDVVVSMTDQQVADAIRIRRNADVIHQPNESSLKNSDPKASGHHPNYKKTQSEAKDHQDKHAAHKADSNQTNSPKALNDDPSLKAKNEGKVDFETGSKPKKNLSSNPDDLLIQGIDLQLEAAILILRTRLLSNYLNKEKRLSHLKNP